MVHVLTVGSTGPFVASNWAVGTFMVISLGTWYVYTERNGRPMLTHSRTVCQKNMEAERRRLARVVEEMPKRFIKQKEPKDGASEGA